MFIVQRARMCLDFSVTVFVVHLVVVCVDEGFPRSFAWWLLMAVCATLMATLAENLCMRREMRAIQLSGDVLTV
jgi:protein SYS1